MLDDAENRWTVTSLANSMKRDWQFPEDWFCWPPDVFAFTSTIFRDTGCYSQVLSEIQEPASGESRTTPLRKWHGNPQWQASVKEAAEKWLSKITGRLLELSGSTSPGEQSCLHELLGDGELYLSVQRIKELGSEIELEELRLLTGRRSGHEKARELFEHLIFVHAVSDEACMDFGLPNAPSRKRALPQYLGNLLLTTWGSLSSLPKHHGTVLPKMRTPVSGLTLRSLSHHITFHRSEVEVMWRATPWINVHENTLNILCVPWPLEIEDECFQSEPETFESVRYFSYTPPQRPDQSHLDTFIRLVRRVCRRVSRLHMLVFPEAALSVGDYERLLELLSIEHLERRIEHVPMIITGIQNDTQSESHNEVRLAAHFAGQWYQVSQRKHHKWKLNESQIRQYQLQGRLSTAREWYENISIAQRRLTFLAPNGWFILCPLICEDLAQLEPVSTIIRGVGPSLLLSPLLDGPQLRARWSARYTSVFADDPGTAVLTLTSLGMVTRSRQLNGGKPDENPSRAVGLWKDAVRGWHTLEVANDEYAQLLTVSADLTEEYTADGRTDYGFTPVFKVDGVKTLSLSELRSPDEDESETLDLESNTEGNNVLSRWWKSLRDQATKRLKPENGDASSQQSSSQGTLLRHSWQDIRELTALTYALDAAIQLRGANLNLVIDLLQGNIEMAQLESKIPKQIFDLVTLLTIAQSKPGQVGVAAEDIAESPTESLTLLVGEFQRQLESAVEEFQQLLEKNPEGNDNILSQWWKALKDQAIRRLKDHEGELVTVLSDSERAERSVSIAILAALHYRMTELHRRRAGDRRRVVDSDPDINTLNRSQAMEILREIESELDKYA
jgi:hypothetical protein